MINKYKKLEEYLEELQNCPDEQLTGELGVYDNFPIHLSGNLDCVHRYFEQSDMYQDGSEYAKFMAPGVKKKWFSYVPGTVIISTEEEIAEWPPTEVIKDYESRGFNGTIQLHPYQNKKMEGDSSRALAHVIKDMGEFLITENISACMPKTRGWNHLDEEDSLSRLVFHNPPEK
jgi:hypothetical protein